MARSDPDLSGTRSGPSSRRPVIVANRAPYERSAGGRMRRGSGGLVTALLPLARRLRADWVACARTSAERSTATAALGSGNAGYEGGLIRYATPSEDELRMHYSVISNPILWYTQHYLWDLAREPRFNGDIRFAWRKGYVQVNRKLARVAAEVARSRDSRPLILSHDYEL